MDVIGIIVEMGTIGVAVYVLYILKTLLGNHINHNTEVLVELKDVIRDLKDTIKDFHGK